MQPRLVYNTPLYVASIIKQATNAIIHNSILQNIFFILMQTHSFLFAIFKYLAYFCKNGNQSDYYR